MHLNKINYSVKNFYCVYTQRSAPQPFSEKTVLHPYSLVPHSLITRSHQLLCKESVLLAQARAECCAFAPYLKEHWYAVYF